ncbi:MarR family winged helix-turn-helix transcriptional regulator [Microvirga rosea]|uniref:MarR family winged helix-turn-helix transcriptional regulator n=1 Tax=Microvirga rosea TaxID=2715425 RepID=UPI001D0A1723|nr:MarR family transcriptional regulator [Microvirga rosea]MCB8821518.1 MarR family transcriptional regulator [Microvirga rosea]
MTEKSALALDNQLCFALYSASHAFGRAYRQFLDPLGLTYPQYVVLLVLWEKDDITVKDIGEKLFLDSGTLTPLLKRLEAGGLIRRIRDREDERQVRIRLTDSGRALKEKAQDIPKTIGCILDLPSDEVSALRRQLGDLRGKLQAAVSKP